MPVLIAKNSIYKTGSKSVFLRIADRGHLVTSYGHGPNKMSLSASDGDNSLDLVVENLAGVNVLPSVF